MNPLLLLAQAGVAATLVDWIVVIIVLAGIVGIAYVVAQQAGLVVPPFLVQILWIVLAVVVAVVAITFLARYL
jgi:hypothetical protein